LIGGGEADGSPYGGVKMREVATIRKISNLRPIKGADRIELARVDGWDVIVKKGEFSEGSLCIYCEIDSVLPDRPEFEFLRSKNFTVKTMKMRGVISQGICFPMSLLPEVAAEYEGMFVPWHEGMDVTEDLGITLSDQDDEDGVFPHFIPRTKEERVQNIDISDMEGIAFIISEKLDGKSATYYLKDGKFGVCSRKCELEESEDHYWTIAKKYDIEGQLQSNMAIQGEIVGPSINKNPLKLDEVDFYIFGVFDINEQEYLPWGQVRRIAGALGIKTVPAVGGMSIHTTDTIDNIVKLADGKSKINSDVRREGLVFRSLNNQPCQFGKVSFKSISNKYLLKR